MKTFIIHVSTDSEREKHVLKQIKKHSCINDYQFINRGDIKDIDKEIAKKLFNTDNITSAISCSYKHYLSYKAIIENKIDMALILEDDIFLEKKFYSIIEKAIVEIKNNKLKNFLISLEDSWFKYVKGSERRKGQFIYPASYGRLAGAYLIDFYAATEIVKEIENHQCTIPIDWFHNSCCEKKLINIYWLHPTIAIQGSAMGNIKTLIDGKPSGYLRFISKSVQRTYKKLLYRLR